MSLTHHHWRHLSVNLVEKLFINNLMRGLTNVFNQRIRSLSKG